MGLFTKLFSKRTWEPLFCKPADIFNLIKECVDINAPLLNLVIEYNSAEHKIGVTSDYSSTRGPFDTVYYCDDAEYSTLEEMQLSCCIDGELFSEMATVKILRDEEVGDPRGNTYFERNGIM